MRDYFSDVKEYLNSHYKLTVKNEKKENLVINSVLNNFSLNESTKYIYEHYKLFEVVWQDRKSVV